MSEFYDLNGNVLTLVFSHGTYNNLSWKSRSHQIGKKMLKVFKKILQGRCISLKFQKLKDKNECEIISILKKCKFEIVPFSSFFY